MTEQPATSYKRTLTLTELADTLGVARSTVYRLAAENRLPIPVIRIGRRLLVSRDVVEEPLASHEATTEVRR